jgi:hypothetical protein
MRIPYYCPYCDQRSTRRWNLDVHIKRKHGGFLLGTPSDRYMGSNPIPNNPYNKIGSSTVADSVADSFPLSSQQSPSTIRPPQHAMDDHRYGTGLSPGVIQKIQELKALLSKYSQYQNNDPDEIVRLAVFYCFNGDNTLLDGKLEQLRSMERRLNGRASPFTVV